MRMFRTTRSRPLARRPLAHAVSGCAAALALTFILPLALGGCDEAGTSGNDRSGTAAAVTPASRSATVAAPYDRSPVDNEAEKALHRIVMPASPEFVQPMDQPGAPPLRFEPPTLHYGVLAPGETATGAVKIWNVGTQPVTLGNFRVSCHCTSVDLTNGVIAPGGYKEFHIFTEPKSGLGDKLVKVRMAFAGYPGAIDYEVRATVALPIRITPSFLMASTAAGDDDEMVPGGPSLVPIETGEVWLESADNRPFRILSAHGMEPEYVGFDPAKDAPRNWYLLRWDLTKFGSDIPNWWVVETDREDCPVIEFRVRHPQTLPRPVPGRNWMLEDQRIAFGQLRVGETYEFPTRLMYLVRPGQTEPRGTGPASYRVTTDLFDIEVGAVTVDGVKRRWVTRLTAKKAPPANLVYETAEFTHGGYEYAVNFIGRIVE